MTTTLSSIAASHLPPTIHGSRRHVGTAVMPDLLATNPQYAKVVDTEFDSLVVEHHMKWSPLLWRSKKRGEVVYDFSDSDFIVDWARTRNKRVKGHTLVWHVTSPEWLKDISANAVVDEMNRHIHTVMGHFYGRIDWWDVVNEALAPDGSWADTVFNRAMGGQGQFITEAFRQAKSSDPTPKLYYNDNKVEGLCVKSDKMFELATRLVKEKTPLDGVGLQAHFDAAGTGEKRPASPLSMYENIDRFGSMLNLSVNISEMDVRIAKLVHMDEINRNNVQKQIYHDTLAACFSHPSFEGVMFWGFTDAHSWVHSFYWNDAPLLFDVKYGKKPAYDGVAQALTLPCKPIHRGWVGEWVPTSPSASSTTSMDDDTKRVKMNGTELPDWKL